MPYRIISCHIMSYHIMSFHIISYQIVSFRIDRDNRKSARAGGRGGCGGGEIREGDGGGAGGRDKKETRMPTIHLQTNVSDSPWLVPTTPGSPPLSVHPYDPAAMVTNTTSSCNKTRINAPASIVPHFFLLPPPLPSSPSPLLSLPLLSSPPPSPPFFYIPPFSPPKTSRSEVGAALSPGSPAAPAPVAAQTSCSLAAASARADCQIQDTTLNGYMSPI